MASKQTKRKPVKLVSSRDEARKSCADDLKEASDKGYDQYALVAMKDGDIYLSHSSISRMRLIGALHMAITKIASGD